MLRNRSVAEVCHISTHLPSVRRSASLTSAGVLVRTLEKDDGTQFVRLEFEKRDQSAVASGIYVVFIEMQIAESTRQNAQAGTGSGRANIEDL